MDGSKPVWSHLYLLTSKPIQMSHRTEDVMIAENIDEWRISLDTLIRDPELRQTLARNAYQSATQQFNRRIGEQIWTNLIQAEQKISTSQRRKF